jgi:hypothetical protein
MYDSLARNATAAFYTTFYNAKFGAYGRDAGAVQGLTLPALVIGSPLTPEIAKKQLALLEEDIGSPGLGQEPCTLRVGAVTSKVLLGVLSSNGLHDTLKLATQTAAPSCGALLVHCWQNNATTCWENWPSNSGYPAPSGSGYPPGANPQKTRNHIFLCGGLGEWYSRHLTGLTPTSPAFATIRIAPKVRPNLGPQTAQGSFKSVRGVISSKRALVVPTGVNSATIQVRKQALRQRHYAFHLHETSRH